ncbi:MAG: hypothetical protein Pg6B_04920 [Candidatus Azobacteroides pseudotrichonymphae]|jgi:hypothetical protein|nr:MAG: hypothetical protein Pg6B_04920 [Candidatus Azobacteroides pseudotrichonymphae]
MITNCHLTKNIIRYKNMVRWKESVKNHNKIGSTKIILGINKRMIHEIRANITTNEKQKY